jgi:hypothetical protein
MSIVKGKFVSVWGEGTLVVTPGELDTDTNEVVSLGYEDDDEGMDSLVDEYFKPEGTSERIPICTECHEYVLNEKGECPRGCKL